MMKCDNLDMIELLNFIKTVYDGVNRKILIKHILYWYCRCVIILYILYFLNILFILEHSIRNVHIYNNYKSIIIAFICFCTFYCILKHKNEFKFYILVMFVILQYTLFSIFVLLLNTN